MSLQITEEQISKWPPDAQAVVRLLMAEVAELRGKVAELERRLAEYEGPKTPQNSSLPPSSQHPHAARPTRPKSKRKRGGQPGHRKYDRALIPTEDCDEKKTLKPTACRRCGTRLSGSDPAPLRHQVWELPEIRPHVTEYQRHRLACPCCSATTCAALPPGVPTGQSGPRLVAFCGLLMAYFRQSKRRTALFLEDLLGQPCCPSLTVKMQNQVSQALAEPYQELNAALTDQPQVFMDESPTKEGTTRAWLWTAVAPTFAVFAICLSRAATAIGQLLGEGFTGTINCDRAKMYWQAGRLQWCWAHLKRDIQALIDHPDRQVKRLGHDLMRQVTAMFQHWHDFHGGRISRQAFRERMAPVRDTVDGLLLRGACSGNARLVGMCNELYGHRDWLWKFIDSDRIQPTNNTAERALRHAVIWRRLCFGTQSAKGSRFVERALTVIETCRIQKRSVFAYVTEAVEAHMAGRKSPSLLPAP